MSKKLDFLRRRNLWKVLIGAAANLNVPGASKHIAPLLDRLYDGEEVTSELFHALREYAGKTVYEAKEIIKAITDARDHSQ
jgi:hypothetical protein